MAWTESRPFRNVADDVFTNATAFSFGTDTLMAALFDDSITPDATAAAASTAFNTGVWLLAAENSDTNWPSGGIALSSVTASGSGTTFTLDAANTPSSGTVTLPDSFGTLVYDATISDRGICYNFFGGGVGVTGGTMTINWAGAGIFTATA